ncbi:MAG: LysE family translocator [Cognatishimia sp.]|uniref:LysE family translocator n=1 Tax=Cognatishimia sp. TaxID=2211648 RepID=UPI003B8D0DD2
MISAHFFLTALVVVLAPGTGVIFTIAMGLGRGPKAALWAALGCTFGILPALIAAALGLAAILHTSAVLFNIMKLLGVAFLLYLAWQAVKEGGALSVRAETDRSSGWTICRRAALINILNPKLSVFFLALLPPFLSGQTATASQEMFLLGGVFMAMTFFVFAGYGIFAAQAREVLLGSERIMRWLNRSFAAIFVALAGRLAFERA